MAHRPRLFDPRTGHRITATRHRQLLRYSDRKVAQFDALADDAHERGLHAKRRATKIKWRKVQERYDLRWQYWTVFRQTLDDQLKRRVEYEAKFAYTGKRKENNRDRANLNIRMRYYGRAPLPTDQEVRKAYYNLLLHGKPPKGWEYAIADWRNDRLSDRGWRRGSWKGGGAHPDVEGRGAMATERQHPSSIDWASNMVVHATLEDFDTLVIGEVEE